MDQNELWKILKEMGIPGHLTWLIQGMHAKQVKKQQLKSDMEQQTGSKSGKEYIKAIYCHPAYLAYAECIMRNAGLDKHKQESRLMGVILTTSDMQMIPLLWQKAKRNKEPLMKVKEKSEKLP